MPSAPVVTSLGLAVLALAGLVFYVLVKEGVIALGGTGQTAIVLVGANSPQTWSTWQGYIHGIGTSKTAELTTSTPNVQNIVKAVGSDKSAATNAAWVTSTTMVRYATPNWSKISVSAANASATTAAYAWLEVRSAKKQSAIEFETALNGANSALSYHAFVQ
jgi:hypothetical protein